MRNLFIKLFFYKNTFYIKKSILKLPEETWDHWDFLKDMIQINAVLF